MSLSIISNPIVVSGGITYNIFAGFLPVEFQFKREDLAISSIGSGINNNIQITTSIDLSSYLAVGDYIYVYGQGLSGNYNYDEHAVITAIDAVSVTLDITYIEGISSGYINYFKNYYVECQLVNADNSDIKILPFSIKDDGDKSGNIYIDVSITRDKLYQVFEFGDSDVVSEERIKFKMQYRQVYTGSAESFTLIDQEIILVYATETPTIESFLNPFDYGELFQGYNCGVTLCHSNENSSDLSMLITYDELDINQNPLSSGNVIKSILSSKYGLIFIDWEKDKAVTANTEYIRFNVDFVSLPDFQAGDFSNDFDIT